MVTLQSLSESCHHSQGSLRHLPLLTCAPLMEISPTPQPQYNAIELVFTPNGNLTELPILLLLMRAKLDTKSKIMGTGTQTQVGIVRDGIGIATIY